MNLGGYTLSSSSIDGSVISEVWQGCRGGEFCERTQQPSPHAHTSAPTAIPDIKFLNLQAPTKPSVGGITKFGDCCVVLKNFGTTVLIGEDANEQGLMQVPAFLMPHELHRVALDVTKNTTLESSHIASLISSIGSYLLTEYKVTQSRAGLAALVPQCEVTTLSYPRLRKLEIRASAAPRASQDFSANFFFPVLDTLALTCHTQGDSLLCRFAKVNSLSTLDVSALSCSLFKIALLVHGNPGLRQLYMKCHNLTGPSNIGKLANALADATNLEELRFSGEIAPIMLDAVRYLFRSGSLRRVVVDRIRPDSLLEKKLSSPDSPCHKGEPYLHSRTDTHVWDRN